LIDLSLYFFQCCKDIMHARKLPRISEPSFDKDYYENGRGYTSKYSSSGKMRSYGGGGGSSSSYRRSVSPDIRNQSPRDRNGPKHHSIRRLDRDHQVKWVGFHPRSLMKLKMLAGY
jgi:hypothetical protein